VRVAVRHLLLYNEQSAVTQIQEGDFGHEKGGPEAA
jgi:hypothetical protein